MENILGQRLKALRKKKNLHQEELANKLNVSKSLIGMYERGHRVPSIDVLKQLSIFFDVSSDYLIGLTNLPGRQASDEVTPHDLKEFFEYPLISVDGNILNNTERKKLINVISALFYAEDRDEADTEK